jgi:acetyl esterase/lipase
MPSVQASLLNLLTRNTVKPRLAGSDPVRSMRALAAQFDRMCPTPRGVVIRPEPQTHCQADWVVPHGLENSDRIVLYAPGGGFSSRTPKGSRRVASRIAKAASARALVVFYRLAPENPYPSGLMDFVAAYEQLLSEGTAAERIVFGGDSAGAALACAALLVLRDDRRPLPAGAFTVSAITDLTDHEHGSRTRNAPVDPMLSSLGHGEADARLLYVGGNRALLEEPYVSPLFGEFTGLPPLLLQVGSTEVLLDDSLRLTKRARTCGVDAEVEVWDDVPHVWHNSSIPEATEAIEHLGDFVRRCCP